MKRNVVLIVIFALVLVLSLFVFRSKETYVLPDVTADGPDMCPPGFVLMCVSKDLAGVMDVVPFPASLPKPCEDTHTPLCLPSPEHTKPAYAKK
jgi:hypothetical protein